MKKFITYILLAIVAILFVYWCIPKSCEPIGKYEQLEGKSNSSLMRDSIKTSHYLIFKKTNDSLINIYKDSLAVIIASKEKIEYNYYALRSIVKKLQSVKVDSFDQVVNVPVIEYNASINSGTMCDSLLMYLESESAIKDSIIYMKDVNISELVKKVNSGEIAKSDLVDLVDELKKELKKAKSDNLKLKILLIIDTLAHFLH